MFVDIATNANTMNYNLLLILLVFSFFCIVLVPLSHRGIKLVFGIPMPGISLMLGCAGNLIFLDFLGVAT